MVTENTTPNRGYQEPAVGNTLEVDVGRLIAALRAIDTDVASALAAIVSKAGLASPVFTGTPTAPTAAPGTDSGQLATTAFVKAALAALVDSAPGALDTLNELAAALGDDPNFAATITALIAAKADAATTYTESEVDALLADKRDKVIPFVDIASAATVNLDPDVSLAFNVTGDVGITSWGTDAPIGSEILTRFAGAPPITGSADLILPTGQSSWGVTAGEMMLWRKISSTQWKALWGPMEAASQATAEAGANNGYFMTALRTKQAIAARNAEVLHVRDQKAAGTDGGSASVGVQVRVFNTVVTNGITGASLSSNQITLPSGTYDVFIKVTGQNVNRHKAWLRTAGGTVLLVGSSEYANSTGNGGNSSFIVGRLVLASPTVLEVAHYCQSAFASNGFGYAANTSSQPEIYSEAIFQKVAD